MCIKQIDFGSCGCLVSEHISRCVDAPLCVIETRKTYNATLCNRHYTGDRAVGAGRPGPGEKRESKLAQTTVVSFEVQLDPTSVRSSPAQPVSKPPPPQRKRAETEPQPKLRAAMEYNDEWKAGKIGLGWDYVGKWKGKLDPEAKEFKPLKL